VGELITVREYWGNHASTSKLGKLYSSGHLIVCEPYTEGEEENENTGHRGVDSNRQA
jgi:hypothetical protein